MNMAQFLAFQNSVSQNHFSQVNTNLFNILSYDVPVPYEFVRQEKQYYIFGLGK